MRKDLSQVGSMSTIASASIDKRMGNERINSMENAITLRASGSASAKTILFGEHAVVYGEPGLAIPVPSLRARAAIHAAPHMNGIRVHATQVGIDAPLDSLPDLNPIRAVVKLFSERTNCRLPSGITITVNSDIPVAAGLGSGAAVSIAILRALSAFFQLHLGADETSSLAYEIEKIHHGTPSGIDNAVIAAERPILFIKGKSAEPINVQLDLPLAIVDSREKSNTIDVVADVRRGYPENAGIIRQIGNVTRRGIDALLNHDLSALGCLMNENQRLLEALTVSNETLNRLTALAVANGALGAKLTGAGRGGNLIALCADTANAQRIKEILTQAGGIVR